MASTTACLVETSSREDEATDVTDVDGEEAGARRGIAHWEHADRRDMLSQHIRSLRTIHSRTRCDAGTP
jgi:hypothetical protein